MATSPDARLLLVAAPWVTGVLACFPWLTACSPDCPAGDVVCDGECTFLDASTLNCGSCGHRCQGLESCVGGECRCDTTHTKYCDGICTFIYSDQENCGDCGVACGGDTPYCVDLQCQRCPDDECLGVCTSVKSDPHNCGACAVKGGGADCGDGGVCLLGNCVFPTSSACEPECQTEVNEVCCQAQPDPVCVRVDVDPENCGECGESCNGVPCTDGLCPEY